MSELLARLAWQRVVLERPPAGTLRRGIVSLPAAPAAALIVVALLAILGVTLARQRRAPR